MTDGERRPLDAADADPDEGVDGGPGRVAVGQHGRVAVPDGRLMRAREPARSSCRAWCCPRAACTSAT